MAASLNRRIFFPTHAIGFGPFQTETYTTVHGAQTVGINTNFTLDPILELGQAALYELVEQVPEIEVTTEKVLDGNPLLYHLATRGAPDGSLFGRANQRSMFGMSVYGDTQNAASGTPTSQIECSGLYWSQHTLTFATDGPFKEALTLVGNNKLYRSSGFTFSPTGLVNTDAPLSLVGSGGVQLRRDMIFYPILGVGDPLYSLETTNALDVNGQVKAYLTILPPDVQGISSSGTNDRIGGDQFTAHIQNITVSINAGRDAVLELGRKEPYFRFMTIPISATCEISTIATEADTISAIEKGQDGFGNNLTNRSIYLRSREGTFVSLGTQNKLQSVSFQGGGTDGGQVTTTYTFITYNFYIVSHPQDPDSHPYPLFA